MFGFVRGGRRIVSFHNHLVSLKPIFFQSNNLLPKHCYGESIFYNQIQLFNTKSNDQNLEDDCEPEPILVTKDRVKVKAVRASGPGGQNVNKVSTAVEVRFNVKQADWIPDDVKSRLLEQQKHRIAKNSGHLIVVAQDERTQVLNRKLAFQRMQDMIDQALVVPKERQMYEGISEEEKERRKEQKRYRSKIKKFRRVNF